MRGIVHKIGVIGFAAGLAMCFSGCGKKINDNEVTDITTEQQIEVISTVTDGKDNDKASVASPGEMSEVEAVVTDDMLPITGDMIKDGVYDIDVNSSSSMFNITACELTVENGQMTAVMHMGGTGYLYVYMGTGEEAVNSDESSYIGFEEQSDGTHIFIVPVDSLNSAVNCTAFSKKKEKWYDRQLCFKADSIPVDCFQNGVMTTVDSLSLSDGEYMIDVKLEGGSGKASVTSPTKLKIEEGVATAEIIMSSENYDYMRVNDEKYLTVNESGNSTFVIPIEVFDYAMPVVADTVAMSEPHEIEYTLYFNSESIAAIE